MKIIITTIILILSSTICFGQIDAAVQKKLDSISTVFQKKVDSLGFALNKKTDSIAALRDLITGNKGELIMGQVSPSSFLISIDPLYTARISALETKLANGLTVTGTAK